MTVENIWVRLKADACAMLLSFSRHLHIMVRLAPLIGLRPNLPILVHIDLKPLGKSVHAGYADAVKTAGNLIGALVKFSAGMQGGHNDLKSRFAADVGGQLRILHWIGPDPRA